MRIVVLVVLVVLALLSAFTGHLSVALALAVVKALLVGSEYMELRHAHRAHLLGFSFFVLAMAIGLAVTANAGKPPA